MMDWSEPVAPARRPPGPWVGYVVAPGLVAAALVAAILAEHAAPIPNLSLIFVLPVIVAAAWYGWGPALSAAILGAAAFNFFLIEPRLTLRIDDPANVWALVLLLVTAAIVSAVGAQSRRRAVAAGQHAHHAQALQDLARQLVAADGRQAIFEAVVQALSLWFAAPVAVLANEGGGLVPQAMTGIADLEPDDADAAAWSLAARLPTRGGEYPTDKARFDFWPLAAVEVVIGVDLSRRDDGRPPAPERLVQALGDYLTVALQRELYARQAFETRVESQGERLKADLLAAVSHDLKTPLSTILFTLQSLRKFGDVHEPEARAELLALAETETSRLSALVGALLDMSRIEADAVIVHPQAASLADLASSAADRARAALAGHAVMFDIDDEAPLVWIDYALAETALANVIENAAKYSPAGAPVRISAKASEGGVIEVRDDGPGFPQPVARLFGKFTRGVQGDGRPPGLGL